MCKFVVIGSALACALALGVVTRAQAQTPIWSEEFNGPQLDRSVWTFDVGGHGFGNQELQYYTARPDNVWIEDGKLVIQALRESYSGKQFTSARLKSHGRLALKYGIIEARIKVPDLANGLWPAFWMLGDNIGQVSWPACGETDILEMGSRGAIDGGVVNRRVQAAAHWDYFGSYASYGGHIDWPVDLYNDYHVYSLTWTPSLLRASVDGTPYWTLDISSGASASMEEFHEPFFLVMNLAVGGINFVEITNPGQITAPFPARLYVDWVRIYSHPSTELVLAEDTAETGNFGVLTETTPVNDSVTYGTDAELYVWNNMVGTSTMPYEGSEAWAFNIGAGNWFGLGVFCLANRNMQHYSDGHLHCHMKTTSTHTIGIGIASSAAGEGWVDLVNGGEQFGLVRDGSWHEVVIPLSRFGNIDFHTIKQILMIRGGAPAAAFQLAIDNVYWSPDVARPTPENGSYGVFTEAPAHKDAGEFVLGADGDFYVWENTLNPLPGSPYEGAASIALTSAPGLGWFGAAFTPDVKHNLTAYRYPGSRLHVALKTSSTVTFQLGMKSGNVNDIGQHWITFASGSDPYGFARDGQWHLLEIPMSDFGGAVDLSEVSQLFELLGVNGPISDIEIDDVYFSGGRTALPPGVYPPPGDIDLDGDVDGGDAGLFANCVAGPAVGTPPADCTAAQFDLSDLDGDLDVDLGDYSAFQFAF